jgi:signal transduction histidine kinase
MTHNPARTDDRAGIAAQLRSLVVRPTPPPLALGLVAAALLAAAETLVLYPLKQIAPASSLAFVYLLGVVAIAIVWGFWMAAATSVASAVVFDYFHIPPELGFIPAQAQDGVALAIFLVVALLTSLVANLARSRAVEIYHRRREISVLAEQQSALRRVATLVARGVPPAELFTAVAKEMADCVGVANAAVLRYEVDGTAVVVSGRYEPALATRSPVGERYSLEGDNVAARVRETGHWARIDNHGNATGSLAARTRELGIRCVVGCPIVVEGQLWGVAVAGSCAVEPLPGHTNKRIGDFADLVATAIANAATRTQLQVSRDSVGVLAEQQAALRRVATLVARSARPSEVYAAVADEIVHCLEVDTSGVWRYERDHAMTLLAGTSRAGSQYLPVGERLTLEGDNLGEMVLRSGRAARHDAIEDAKGSAIARMRELGIRAGVAAPVMVDGRIWGLAIAATTRADAMPPDSEERIGDFADLVATAIANAATRAELIASRARIVTAADNARRRLERDLHDGAQQRLVSLGLQVRLAEAAVPTECGVLRDQLSDVVGGLSGVLSDLQEISRGIHPAILSEGGLGPALKTLARRSSVPTVLDLDIDRRLPESIEVGTYYVVAEALTNAAKHASASKVNLHADTRDDQLCVLIRDDGIGGADPRRGSGLIGLIDRVETLGGHMQIDSPPAVGTMLHITIPLHQEDN